jgi:hypothetical protein
MTGFFASGEPETSMQPAGGSNSTSGLDSTKGPVTAWSCDLSSSRLDCDVQRPTSTNDAVETLELAKLQLKFDRAAARGQVPLPELSDLDFFAYRPRARRLSEHGCGCCGLDDGTGSSVADSAAQYQATLPLIQEACIDPADTRVRSGAALADTVPAWQPTSNTVPKFVSPFAGDGLVLPDEQQQAQQHDRKHQASSKQGSRGLCEAAAALSSCQLVDDEGSPVPVFAIVSITHKAM